MKLSEMKGQASIEAMADMITPAISILQDEEVAKEWKSAGNKLKLAQIILKNHSKEIIEILAILDGVSVKKYNEKNMVAILNDVYAMLDDTELLDFFQSLGQKNA